MNKQETRTYMPPCLDVQEFETEQGFAQSNPAYGHGNEGSPWEWD